MADTPTNGSDIQMGTEAHIGWARFVLLLAIAFVIYAFASHLFFPALRSVSIFSSPQAFAYCFGTYLTMFVAMFAVFSGLLVLARFGTLRSRQGYLPRLLSYALIPTLIIGSTLIYGGWYGQKRYMEDQSAQHSTSGLEEQVKN